MDAGLSTDVSEITLYSWNWEIIAGIETGAGDRQQLAEAYAHGDETGSTEVWKVRCKKNIKTPEHERKFS